MEVDKSQEKASQYTIGFCLKPISYFGLLVDRLKRPPISSQKILFKVFHLNIIVFSDVLDSGEKFCCYDVMYLDLNDRVCTSILIER